jgi:hypothetical protein
MIDASADFYGFVSRGLLPATILQSLRLKRRRERFDISPPRRATAGELLGPLSDLVDDDVDFPSVRILRNVLSTLEPDTKVGREQMRAFFRE